jgi:hypothetical protein
MQGPAETLELREFEETAFPPGVAFLGEQRF